MRARQERRAEPKISVTEIDLTPEEDWYTPDLLRLKPKKVSVVVGNKGAGRVRCVITEDGWERRSVALKIVMEEIPVPGTHYKQGFHTDTKDDVGRGNIATVTAGTI